MPELSEVIVSTPEELAACCTQLAAQPHFGFDTEFVGEDTYHPRLCLIQAAAPDGLFLIDPLSAGPLDAFWRLVVDPQRVTVVHAGREEVRLCRLWTGQTPGNLFDLQLAAGLVGLAYPLGHGPLIGQLLGVHLSKGETRTEWRHRPLTPEQIRYAFDDVRCLLPAWKKLAGRLEKLGRAAWAAEEFDRLARTASPEEPALEERWRKLRGLGSLDRRRLAVVRALFQWREETAARTNRPARTIVRDDLIVEIARRNPTRERDLHTLRGLPRRDVDAILETVTTAAKLLPEQWPAAMERDQDPPQVALTAAVLTAVLGDVCARLRLAPNLVGSNQDVKRIVRARCAGGQLLDDTPLTQGWRATAILPELLAVLDGRRTLRIADLTAAAPFAYGEVGQPPTEESGG
ncbi:MAG TPA: ribonuclease D [Gemmataceae bacterium]|nr:ribonuclease D [Gemmataceae bacterium]